jgi:DNA-binding transcriptional LysR family regulator
LANDPDLLTFAGDYLKSASTGVDRLQVERQPVSESEIRSLVSDITASKLLTPLSDGMSRNYPLPDGSELRIEGNGGNSYYRVRVEAAHVDLAGGIVPLELKEESDGTRRLLYLLPALHQLREHGAVFFIDEIDRSLHPMLVRTFLASFLKLCEGEQRQIIVTTHESSLLDQELLRRDEIWFAEKDRGAATRLYSLTDFNVRKDLEIRKHYLQGRFGAVPFLGGIRRLLEDSGHNE